MQKTLAIQCEITQIQMCLYYRQSYIVKQICFVESNPNRVRGPLHYIDPTLLVVNPLNSTVCLGCH